MIWEHFVQLRALCKQKQIILQSPTVKSLQPEQMKPDRNQRNKRENISMSWCSWRQCHLNENVSPLWVTLISFSSHVAIVQMILFVCWITLRSYYESCHSKQDIWKKNSCNLGINIIFVTISPVLLGLVGPTVGTCGVGEGPKKIDSHISYYHVKHNP